MKVKENKTDLAKATQKMRELLDCDNERVVLSAAKELISIAEAEQKENNCGGDIHLEVSIKIVE